MSKIMLIINIVLIVIILSFGINWLWLKVQEKNIGGRLTQKDFEAGKHTAQIIDVREKATFKKKHIMGARNIPMSMFKYQYSDLRSDLPVFLYSDAKAMTLKAARILKKKGYSKVFWLEDTFDKWSGQTKASKY